MTSNDAKLMWGILNDPDFIKYVGDRGVKTITDAAEYISDRVVSSYRENGFSMYLVELQDGSVPIGICGLVNRPGLQDVDIGFAFLPPYRQHGFAYEAAAAMLRYGYETVGLDQIAAIVSPANTASVNLLEKLGFNFHQLMCLPGEDEPIKYYLHQAKPETAGKPD